MTITFQGDEVVAPVHDPEATILEVSIKNKIPHFRECGGRGRCTTCRVRVLDGRAHLSERTAREARIAERRSWDEFTRLACQTHVNGDVHVRRLIQSAADLSLLLEERLQAEPGRDVLVAILVCDIQQFTPFVEANLPYDVVHILNRFFADIGEPILLNGGFIYQYIGDQVVGLFGLDGASPAQSCLSAVRAGLGMMEGLRGFNEQIEEEFGVHLEIRIGAHFGELIVGDLGHPARRDFSVVGDAMNVASRIEGANKELGTTFLVSEALHERLPLPVRAGRREQVALKGKQGLHTLVEVLGFEAPDPAFTLQSTARQLLGDQDRFASAFYQRLFELAPQTRSMFSGDLKAQGRMLTQTLQLAVRGFDRFNDVMPGLVALGRDHVDYGVQIGHYDVFRQVFMDTVQELLGTACGPEGERAWGLAIDRILDAVRQGARQREEVEARIQRRRRTEQHEGAASTVQQTP